MEERIKRLRDYRKSMDLYIFCGDTAKPERVRCIRCTQIAAVKERMRSERRTPEQVEEKRRYAREYYYRKKEV